MEDKLYRIKTKEGNHINTKVKDDGTRAAIQFDENNNMRGPVDLEEVDSDELYDDYYDDDEDERKKGCGEILFEKAVVEPLADAMGKLAEAAVEATFKAIGFLVKDVVAPAVKSGAEIVTQKVKDSIRDKKRLKAETALKEVAAKAEHDYYSSDSVVQHSPNEVEDIVNNMKNAAIYIAASIRELQRTVVTDEGTNPERTKQLQESLQRLSSDEVMSFINCALEDKNRASLDEASIRIFSAFRDGKFIVDEELVPISNYISG